MGAALVQTDGRTARDRPMDKTKVTGDFRGYEDALKAVCKYIQVLNITYFCLQQMSGFYTSHDTQLHTIPTT
jgi:hypothetical protein